MIKYMIVLTLILLSSSSAHASYNITEEKIFDEYKITNDFSKIYVEGFGVNSDGFKLILSTYERRKGISKTLLADIEYILISQGDVVYSKRVEQVPLSLDNRETILDHHTNVALEEGKNYTGMARIYLYEKGISEYYVTTISDFVAKNDAEITEVFGDSIGASATIKSKSMVPLNATIIFTLKQDNKIIETKELDAPSIMSNEKEKTVNILWTDNVNPGTYIVSIILKNDEIIDKHDKVFTVENKITESTNISSLEEENKVLDTPGLTSVISILVILILFTIWRRK